MKTVKRYQNRKLYDTSESRYVTLSDIADMIKEGEDVKIVDNSSGEDLTSLTLTQIIFEEEKKKQSLLPLAVLKGIIQSGPGQVVNYLVNKIDEGVQSISQARDEVEGYVEKFKKGDFSIEEMKGVFKEILDGKVRPKIEKEARQLRRKIGELEKKLTKHEK